MTKETRMPSARVLRHWGFVILSSFVLPHSSFCDDVIARIGEIELHATDIENPGTLDAASLRKLAEAILVQRLVLKEALEKKWDQQPETQKLIQNTREAAIADSYLKNLCQPPDSFPSEPELKAAYEAAKPSLQQPRSFHLAQIFISEDRLETVKARLKADPTSFAQIAREMSEHQSSAKRDGDIGWLTEAQIQPEILARLPKLALNVISEPLKLGDGWHILKVLDVREAHTPFLEQVRELLTQRLRAEKARSNMQAYMTEMLQKHPVALDGVALSKLARP
ncbi:MAG: peptidylprolyl isomerase [Verrucomicrobiaceae bacterium]|nr:peptidylprolyl isomerase [Verrucomicrobiaceae bacterium]